MTRENVYYSSYDLAFGSGESPREISLNTELSYNAIYLEINNSGSGDMTIEIDSTGSYGDPILLEAGTIKRFERNIRKVRLTHLGTDTKYNIYAE